MSLPAIPGAVQGSSDTPSGSSPTLPPINGGKSGGRGTVDISQLLGETLSKLISEKRGTSPELLTMGGDEGRISLKEFGDAVVPLGLAPAEVSLIFGHFDKKGSGFISFEELHRELTARVAQRGARKTRTKGDRLKAVDQNPLHPPPPGDAPVLRPSQKGVATSKGGIQKGLPLSRSAGSLLQAPSWDPLSATLDPKNLKAAPLWRDDAMDATHGSRSLMRALSAAGSLSRPSVSALKEVQKKTEVAKEIRRQSSSASGVFKPKLHFETHEEIVAIKSGDADECTSKIHDEELVEQQLDAAIAKKKEQIKQAINEQANPMLRELDRILTQQQRTIEARGNSLLAKANEIRAGNADLREYISKLRLERRLHQQFKINLSERLSELTKQIPTLVDRVNVLLFEGEKVQVKRQQTQQDAEQHRTNQEDLLEDVREQLMKSEEEIVKLQEAAYSLEQTHTQHRWDDARSSRQELETAQNKLGYLRWKSSWWSDEFERLRKATKPMLSDADHRDGLVLDFTAVTRGQEMDYSPIDTMMGRYHVMRSDCDSLEHFLDSVLGPAVNKLDIELVKLQSQRQGRLAEAAYAAENQRPTADSALSDAVAFKLAQEIEADCEREEKLLRDAFEPTKALLRALAAPADFATLVREAEAQRLVRYSAIKGGKLIDDGHESAPSPAKSTAADEGEPAGVEEGATAVEGAEAEAAGDANEVAAEEAGGSEAEAPAPSSPKQPAGMITLIAAFEKPSKQLLKAAAEMEEDHNIHRVPLLDEALARCKQELLAVHDAAKRFKPILDHLAFPHPSTASRLPAKLQKWGGVGDAEVLSVHAEFKKLAQESEMRLKQEALREEEAAHDAKNARRSPHAHRPPQQSSPTLGASTAEAAAEGLSASQSLPALN
jgi:hypothetical protein